MRKIGERGIIMLKELFEEKLEKLDELITLKFAAKNSDANIEKSYRKYISDYIDNIVKEYEGIIGLKPNLPFDFEMFSMSILVIGTKNEFEEFKQKELPLFKDSQDYQFFKYTTDRIDIYANNFEDCIDANISYACTCIATIITDIYYAVLENNKCTLILSMEPY